MLDRFTDQLGGVFIRQWKRLAQSILRAALLDGIQQELFITLSCVSAVQQAVWLGIFKTTS